MKMSIVIAVFLHFVVFGSIGTSLCNSSDYSSKTFCQYSFLSGRNFSSEDFGRSRFCGADFTNSSLLRCRFMFADFNANPEAGKTLFDGSNLSGSKFKFADCRNVSFKNCEMIRTWLWYADFRAADFTNADLTDAIVFHWKIGFRGKDKTIVKGANFKDVWGLTNKQKKYLRRNGALNVPNDCDEEGDRLKFKAWMDKINKELSIWNLPKVLLSGVLQLPKTLIIGSLELPKFYFDISVEWIKFLSEMTIGRLVKKHVKT